MKQIVAQGIVLARTDFGEADRIITILTRDEGKIRGMAKGVRRVKSKLAGGIELFSVSHISFIRGKSDIHTITSTKLDKHYGNIVKDINRTMFTYEVLKTINRLTEDSADSDYFDLLRQMLESLNDLKLDQSIIQFWFNLQLLNLAGHTPNLKTDSEGQKLNEKSSYNFDYDHMAFIENQQGSFDQRHVKLLRLGLALDSPQPISQIVDLDKILPDCLRLTSTMLKQFRF